MPQTAALPALFGAAVFATLGYAALTTAMRTGEPASMAALSRTREATLALFDAAIGQLAARLH